MGVGLPAKDNTVVLKFHHLCFLNLDMCSINGYYFLIYGYNINFDI